jgi:hypothetical protein
MVDTLLGIAIFLGIGIVAIALLAWSDMRRHRRLEQRTPIPIRIGRIRDGATFMVRQFQRAMERGPAERIFWVGPVLDYYRRLETLATEPRPSVQQARRLAEEAGQYEQQTRLKGVNVAQQARKLADLAQQLQEQSSGQ